MGQLSGVHRIIVRVMGFTAELNATKFGSNSGHMSTADELDCASEELRENGHRRDDL